jgi:hypothetical protein
VLKVLADKEIPKFDERVYTQVALNDLVTYAVYHLSQTSEEISAEDIVAACFLLFPKRFELRGYPQWPDSTVVNKRWIDCRKKGYIKGSTAQGFKLTPDGLKVAERVEKILVGQRRVREKANTELRTRAGRFVHSLGQSDAAQLYGRDGNADSVSEFDFRNMLLCTMESSASVLRSNLEQFRQYVSLYDREDLMAMLDECETKFASILTEESKHKGQYRGGMLRQKVK